MTAPKTKGSTYVNTSPTWVDAILRSMLDNEALISDLEKVFVAEVMDKLKSGEISKITDLLLLGFSVDIVLNIMLKKFQKLQILINDPGILRSTEIKKNDLKRGEAFKRKYRITEEDILLLTKIAEGVHRKNFKEETNLSISTANRKIRKLYKRLGLGNATQLLYVAGRMHLVPFEPECLRFEEGE